MWKPEHRLAADRSGLRYPSDLTDAEWAIVAPMIPPGRHGGRRRSRNGTPAATNAQNTPTARICPVVPKCPGCTRYQSRAQVARTVTALLFAAVRTDLSTPYRRARWQCWLPQRAARCRQQSDGCGLQGLLWFCHQSHAHRIKHRRSNACAL
jgi:transposase